MPDRHMRIRAVTFLFVSSVLFASVSASAASVVYELDPKKSEITFIAGSVGHEFEGKTNTFSGNITVDPDTKSFMSAQAVVIPVASISTGIPARDHAMQHTFDMAHHPNIEFTVSGIVPNGPKKYQVSGLIKMHGHEKEITFIADAETDPDYMSVSAEVPLKLSYFDLHPPVMLGFLRVSDDLKVVYHTVWHKRL